MPEDFLEGLSIGFLILDLQGNLILSNHFAHSICDQLLQLSTVSEPLSSPFPYHHFLPQPICRMCQAVIESQELFPEQSVIIEDIIPLHSSTTVQIRARWLELETDSYLLVMLETEPPMQLASDPQSEQLIHQPIKVWRRQARAPKRTITAQLHATNYTKYIKKCIKSLHAQRTVAKWLKE